MGSPTFLCILAVLLTNAITENDACLTIVADGVRKYTKLARAFQVREKTFFWEVTFGILTVTFDCNENMVFQAAPQPEFLLGGF